jgi:hypothetical protein
MAQEEIQLRASSLVVVNYRLFLSIVGGIISYMVSSKGVPFKLTSFSLPTPADSLHSILIGGD